MDNQVSYATVYVSMTEDTEKTAVTDTDLTLGQRLAAAAKGSVSAFGTFVLDLLVFCVGILPFAIAAAAAVIVIRLILRKRRGKKAGE